MGRKAGCEFVAAGRATRAEGAEGLEGLEGLEELDELEEPGENRGSVSLMRPGPVWNGLRQVSVRGGGVRRLLLVFLGGCVRVRQRAVAAAG
jgi:hypothetical protein